MMQTAENRFCPHTMAVTNPMAAPERREVIERAMRNAWPQTHVRPPSVVVHDHCRRMHRTCPSGQRDRCLY